MSAVPPHIACSTAALLSSVTMFHNLTSLRSDDDDLAILGHTLQFAGR